MSRRLGIGYGFFVRLSVLATALRPPMSCLARSSCGSYSAVRSSLDFTPVPPSQMVLA